MKKQLLTGALAASLFAVGSAAMPRSAEAFSVVGCTTPSTGTLSSFNIADNVTNTTACQYVSPATNNTNDRNAFNINTLLNPGFFGFTDWIQNTQYFNPVDALSGSFDLDNIFFDTLGAGNWEAASEVMLLFKDGNNTSTLVGYLYNKTKDGSFAFTQPWGELFGGPKQVSHISVYYRAGSTPIPTPAILPGLIGMGVAAIRKKKQADGEIQDA